MLTNSDINRLKETFATKDELQMAKNDLKNDLVNFKDALLHEILAMRDELSVVLGYREQIEDHEHRLEKLEKKIS